LTKKAGYQDSRRVQESLLAPIEKVALLKLASWMPAWVNPDHLTLIGLLSMLLAGASYYFAGRASGYLFAASGFIVLNWFGDSLDGTLARFRQKQRPRYGYYVDHMIDAFGTLFLAVGLGASGYMSFTLSLLFLIVYYLLSIQSYLATHVFQVFRISFWKLSPTEIRLAIIAGNTYAYFRPEVSLLGRGFRLFDVGAVIAVAGMLSMVLFTTIQNTVRLYREERL
jgi:archaetidylinositol phosphate synthase